MRGCLYSGAISANSDSTFSLVRASRSTVVEAASSSLADSVQLTQSSGASLATATVTADGEAAAAYKKKKKKKEKKERGSSSSEKARGRA